MASKNTGMRLIKTFIPLVVTRGLGLFLGLAVSVLLANRFGAGATTDAFFFARRLFTGVSEALLRVISVIYIPSMVRALYGHGSESARSLFTRHFLKLTLLSLAGTAVIYIFSPWVIAGLVPGFDSGRAELAVLLLRIFVLALPVTTATALTLSILNASKRYSLPELLNQFPRLMVVLVLFFLVPPFGVVGLALTLVGGRFLVILLMVPMIVTVLRNPLTEEKERGEIKVQSSTRILSILIIHGYGLATVWLDFAFVSTSGVGGISVLEFGQRLMNIIPSVLTSSLITIMYTEFSHHIATGDGKHLYRTLVRMGRIGLFVLIPLIAFIVTTSDLIVGIIIHHGAFSAEAAHHVSSVMRWYGPAIIFSFLSNALITLMFADEASPRIKFLMCMITVGICCRILFLNLFVKTMGASGAALSASLSSCIALIVLYPLLKRHWGNFLQTEDLKAIFCIIIATSVAVTATHLMITQIMSVVGDSNITVLLMLIGSFITAMSIYVGCISWFGLEELSAIKALFKKKQSLQKM